MTFRLPDFHGFNILWSLDVGDWSFPILL